MIGRLKRSHPDGLFSRHEISTVVLLFLEADGQMGRKDLVSGVTKALGLPGHHEKRIEIALENLERDGKILAGTKTVTLIRD